MGMRVMCSIKYGLIYNLGTIIVSITKQNADACVPLPNHRVGHNHQYFAKLYLYRF